MAAPRLDGSRRALPATLVEVAEHRLRDAILSGALRPGQKIVEEQLCTNLGISRAPLREALRLLASGKIHLEGDLCRTSATAVSDDSLISPRARESGAS